MNTPVIAPVFTLGELMRKARTDAGFDQIQLSEKLGVARNTLSSYETGRSHPSFDVVVNWARICGVSLEWLAQGVETEKAPIANDGGREVRPKGFEPLTFWSVVSPLISITTPETADDLLALWNSQEYSFSETNGHGN